ASATVVLRQRPGDLDRLGLCQIRLQPIKEAFVVPNEGVAVYRPHGCIDSPSSGVDITHDVLAASDPDRWRTVDGEIFDLRAAPHRFVEHGLNWHAFIERAAAQLHLPQIEAVVLEDYRICAEIIGDIYAGRIAFARGKCGFDTEVAPYVDKGRRCGVRLDTGWRRERCWRHA